MKIHGSLLLTVFAALLSAACSINNSKEVVSLDIAGGRFTVVSPDQFLEHAEILQLEFRVECAVHEYPILVSSTDEYYVMDRNNKFMPVYRFGRDGRFLNTIGRFGKGPGEYSWISEVVVHDSLVDFLCGKQVLTYDRENRIISQRKLLDYSASSFVRDEKTGDYFFYTGAGYQYFIQRVDAESGKLVDSIHPWYPDDLAHLIQTFSKRPDGMILFYEPHLNRIFELANDSLEEKYILDYGDMNRKREDFTFAGGLSDILSRIGWWAIAGVRENAGYLYLNLVKTDPLNDTGQYFHLIYNKKSKILYRLGDSEEFSHNLMTAFAISDKNELWFSAIPANIMKIDSWKTVLEKEKIDPEGNPIIIKINMGFLE